MEYVFLPFGAFVASIGATPSLIVVVALSSFISGTALLATRRRSQPLRLSVVGLALVWSNIGTPLKQRLQTPFDHPTKRCL